VLTFGEKLPTWLALLFLKRIEDRFDFQRVSRKKMLKPQRSCVYFLSDVEAGLAGTSSRTKPKGEQLPLMSE